MKSTISIHQLKNTVINKSYAIPEALNLINNRLGNEYFSLADLLDSIKHKQLRTVIYMTGYFSWLNKGSFISSIGGRKYNLPIDYSINNFLCSEKSIKKKIEEIDHVKYEIKSPYLSIDLDIDNPCGEMNYLTNYDNNVISVPLRVRFPRVVYSIKRKYCNEYA